MNQYNYWVAPKLTDGLGNRLFQYASAVYYAFQEKKECVFFLPRCMKTDHGDFNSIFRLFPKTRIVETENSWEEVLETCEHFDYQEVKFNIDKNLVIQGYRQNYEYFDGMEILPNFLNALGVTRMEELNKEYLSNKENLFFIHVRIGDYKFLPQYHINIQKYYNEAMNKIPSNSTILFFSDEIELCGKSFEDSVESLGHSIQFCLLKNEIEVLYLMSHCERGCITGNSTFSYWGAYFLHQNYKNALCIYPKNFGKDLPIPKNLFPPYGLVLESL
jgi:hypothetical protein